jgi:hypothetical protein
MLHYALVLLMFALGGTAMGFRGIAGVSGKVDFGWLLAVTGITAISLAVLTGRPPPVAAKGERANPRHRPGFRWPTSLVRAPRPEVGWLSRSQRTAGPATEDRP